MSAALNGFRSAAARGADVPPTDPLSNSVLNLLAQARAPDPAHTKAPLTSASTLLSDARTTSHGAGDTPNEADVQPNLAVISDYLSRSSNGASAGGRAAARSTVTPQDAALRDVAQRGVAQPAVAFGRSVVSQNAAADSITITGSDARVLAARDAGPRRAPPAVPGPPGLSPPPVPGARPDGAHPSTSDILQRAHEQVRALSLLGNHGPAGPAPGGHVGTGDPLQAAEERYRAAFDGMLRAAADVTAPPPQAPPAPPKAQASESPSRMEPAMGAAAIRAKILAALSSTPSALSDRPTFVVVTEQGDTKPMLLKQAEAVANTAASQYLSSTPARRNSLVQAVAPTMDASAMHRIDAAISRATHTSMSSSPSTALPDSAMLDAERFPLTGASAAAHQRVSPARPDLYRQVRPVPPPGVSVQGMPRRTDAPPLAAAAPPTAVPAFYQAHTASPAPASAPGMSRDSAWLPGVELSPAIKYSSAPAQPAAPAAVNPSPTDSAASQTVAVPLSLLQALVEQLQQSNELKRKKSWRKAEPPPTASEAAPPKVASPKGSAGLKRQTSFRSQSSGRSSALDSEVLPATESTLLPRVALLGQAKAERMVAQKGQKPHVFRTRSGWKFDAGQKAADQSTRSGRGTGDVDSAVGVPTLRRTPSSRSVSKASAPPKRTLSVTRFDVEQPAESRTRPVEDSTTPTRSAPATATSSPLSRSPSFRVMNSLARARGDDPAAGVVAPQHDLTAPRAAPTVQRQPTIDTSVRRGALPEKITWVLQSPKAPTPAEAAARPLAPAPLPRAPTASMNLGIPSLAGSSVLSPDERRTAALMGISEADFAAMSSAERIRAALDSREALQVLIRDDADRAFEMFAPHSGRIAGLDVHADAERRRKEAMAL